jgi:protease II
LKVTVLPVWNALSDERAGLSFKKQNAKIVTIYTSFGSTSRRTVEGRELSVVEVGMVYSTAD